MTVAQMWTVIGILVAAFAGMIAMMQRWMSLQTKMMTDALDGNRSEVRTGLDGLRSELHTGLAGVRSEMHTGLADVRSGTDDLRSEMHAAIGGLRGEMHMGFNGLRQEMVGRIAVVERRLEVLDTLNREVRALTLKVFGDRPPDTS